MENNDEKVVIKLKKELLQSERKERRKKRIKTTLIVFLCIFLLTGGFAVGYRLNTILHPSEEVSGEKVLGEIEYILKKRWLYQDEYDDFLSEIEDKAFYGMTSFEEDPYTTYMSKEEADSFASNINLNYVGIGVQYEMNDNKAVVKRVFKNSPAEVSGIEVGDIITHVDKVSVEDKDATEIKAMVTGVSGTKVTITVLKGNDSKDIVVTRESVDSSSYAYTYEDVVVLEISSFGEYTAENVENYLNAYCDYQKLIIDLRNNGGGYQSSVRDIAGLFIGSNQVYMRQVDKDGNEVLDKTGLCTTYDNFEKIVILTNGSTASAAEVLTICLKEQLDNVVVVGETTYGKGVMQSEFSLSNGGYLKITTYKWLSPNGVWINEDGITPDIEVKLDDVLYELFYTMEEEESYRVDSVSDYVKVCEEALSFLDYDVNRTDGYFDQSFEDALNEFKADHDLSQDGILDLKTYNAIYYATSKASTLPQKDLQLLKAIEVLGE